MKELEKEMDALAVKLLELVLVEGLEESDPRVLEVSNEIDRLDIERARMGEWRGQ